MKPNSINSLDEQHTDEATLTSNEENSLDNNNDLIMNYYVDADDLDENDADSNNDDDVNEDDDDDEEDVDDLNENDDEDDNKYNSSSSSIENHVAKSKLAKGLNKRVSSKKKKKLGLIATNNNKTISKKRKCRTTFNKLQLNALENEFNKSNFISSDRIDYLIDITGLDSRIIKNWFKNKRSRVLSDSKYGANNQNQPKTIQSIKTAMSISSSSSSSLTSPSLFKPDESSKKNLMNETSKSNSRHQKFHNIVDKSEYTNGLSILISNNESNKNRNGAATSTNNLNGLLNIVNSINPKSTAINTQTKLSIRKVSTNKAKSSERNHSKQDNDDAKCQKCFSNSKSLCVCNISKSALTRLYKNFPGFLNASTNMSLALDNAVVNNLNRQTSIFKHQVQVNDQIRKNMKPYQTSLESLLTNINNSNNNGTKKPSYVISYERFVLFETDANVEKIFEVL